MCRSRPWPRRPSTPTGRWWWRCAAAIFAKASPASWKSGRHGLRGSERRWYQMASQPVFAQGGYAGHASLFELLRGCATRSPKGEAWWSQAGSNRRPRHCERRALPAELWPHRDRVEKRDGGQQSAPFTIRAKVKSRTAKSRFSEAFVRNFPCLGGGEPIFSG